MKRFFFSVDKKQLQFHIVLNIFVLVFITYASFYNLPLSGFKDRFYYFLLLLLIQFITFGFLYFLSLVKGLFYILFPILFIAFSVCAFWVYSQDIVINDGVIKATIESKPDIVADLVSWQLVLYIVVIILVLVLILRWFSKLSNNSYLSTLTIAGLLSIVLFCLVIVKKKSLVSSRLPFSVVYSLIDYSKAPLIGYHKIDRDVNSGVESLQIILILGESVRADHLSLNGYSRETLPMLSQRKNIVSLSNLFTNKTYTAVSLPRILSNQSINDSIGTKFTSLIDILNQAKVKTTWIGNQTPESSYEYFINNAKKVKMIDPYHSEFSFKKKLDEMMLPFIKSEMDSSKNQLIIGHMMGSHWYYENRYSDKFRKYKPVIHSKHVASNSSDEMINSYDNTIIYLDYFLNSIIENVEKQNSKTILIYISDHGEALGENGVWLHAQNELSIMNPALIIWYSDKFSKSYPNIVTSLNENKNQKITTDFLYHSVLQLFKINDITLHKDKSIIN